MILSTCSIARSCPSISGCFLIPASTLRGRSKGIARLGTGLLLLVCLVFSPGITRAQLMNLQSVYFENQYLANPSMAGLGKGLHINLDYQQQLDAVQGSPVLKSATFDFNSGSHVGLGLIVEDENAGLLSRTNALVSYAYHVQLNNTDLLNFGLSLGINNASLDNSAVVGDRGDASSANFNQRGITAIGGFGISYLHNGLTLQTSIPTIHILGGQDQSRNVDRTNFYSAASYLIPLCGYKSGITLEPKIALRAESGSADIVDAGANLSILNACLNLMAMYHSNDSFTIGTGLTLKKFGMTVSFTNNTSHYSSFATNTIEVGMRFGWK